MNTVNTESARKQYPLLPDKPPEETTLFLVTLPILFIVIAVVADKRSDLLIGSLLFSLLSLPIAFYSMSIWLNHRKLDYTGLLVQGVIIDKWDVSDSESGIVTGACVAYQFSYLGSVWTGMGEVHSFVCLILENSVTIRFLPNNPAISRMEFDSLL